jgi:predicted DNA binding CopG/RHH family protein
MLSVMSPTKKKQITIRIDGKTLRYFKNLAHASGMPYQNLINLYLRDCIQNRRKPNFKWSSRLTSGTL